MTDSPVQPNKVFNADVAFRWAALGSGVFLTLVGSGIAYVRGESSLTLFSLAIPFCFGFGISADAVKNWLGK